MGLVENNEESDALSDCLLIISAETIRADGTPAKLKDQYGSDNPPSHPPSLPLLDLLQDRNSWSTNPPWRAPKRLSSISVVIYLTLLRRLGRQYPTLAAALRRDDQQTTSGGWNGEVPRLDDRSDLSTRLADLLPRDITHSTILRRWCVQVQDGQFSHSTDEQRIRRRCQCSVSYHRSRSVEEESDDQCSIGKFQYSDQCSDDQYNERILHVSITIERRSKASRDSQHEERSATVSAPTSEVHLSISFPVGDGDRRGLAFCIVNFEQLKKSTWKMLGGDVILFSFVLSRWRFFLFSLTLFFLMETSRGLHGSSVYPWFHGFLFGICPGAGHLLDIYMVIIFSEIHHRDDGDTSPAHILSKYSL